MQNRESKEFKLRQPNSHHCFACGLLNQIGLQLEFFDNGVDQVRCEATIPENYNGYPGVVHGGVVAAMLDEVIIRTAMIRDTNHFMMTARMELKYRQPVPTGTPLALTGRMTRDRGRIARGSGDLRLPDGSVAVEAELTMADMPSGFEITDRVLEELGWQVYD